MRPSHTPVSHLLHCHLLYARSFFASINRIIARWLYEW